MITGFIFAQRFIDIPYIIIFAIVCIVWHIPSFCDIVTCLEDPWLVTAAGMGNYQIKAEADLGFLGCGFVLYEARGLVLTEL